MKCGKCGVNYSERVYKIHIHMCKAGDKPVKEVMKSDEIIIESKDYTLNELLQMALDSPNRTAAPSTIKRWKEERLKKELGI